MTPPPLRGSVGRNRLLTLLAAVSATVMLQAAPAAAQISLPGVGDIDVGSGDDDCLELGVDVKAGDLLGLDPKVCVLGEDGKVLDVDGKVKLGEAELDLEESTTPVTDAVDRARPPANPSPHAPRSRWRCSC